MIRLLVDNILKYLGCGKRQSSGEKEICIGRASVNPQVPKDRTENRSHQKDASNDERMSKNWGNIDCKNEEFKINFLQIKLARN